MKLEQLAGKIPEEVLVILIREGIITLTPAQEKAVNAGVLERANILVCTPTASGKTLIAELAIAKILHSDENNSNNLTNSTNLINLTNSTNLINLTNSTTERSSKEKILKSKSKSKAVYIVPLVALANEKYRDFKRKYGSLWKIALATGDFDSADGYLGKNDLIICTSEKLDSLIRHRTPWIEEVKLVVIDEIHLLNDVDRGPTLEILLTLLRLLSPKAQLVGLSATIGNAEELASWLKAKLIKDAWRPVPLKKGIIFNNKIEFFE